MSLMTRTKAAVLEPLRRSGREVAWTTPWMGLGNYLMLGLWAHEVEGRRILRHPGYDMLDTFPVFASDYLIDANDVRFTDQRLAPWSGGKSDRIRSWETLESFVNTALLPGSPIAHLGTRDQGSLVVNVRRGDYYSVPEHRANFGMPIESYVETAIQRALEDDGEPSSIVVVSDDIPWCRDHLDLAKFAPVTFREQGDPTGDLATLIHAERLIIPNSTFSMWGGYIGDLANPGRKVYAPWLFSRQMNGGRGEGHGRDWTVINEIPGGWDQISE